LKIFNLKNVVFFALKKLSKLSVIFEKILIKLFDLNSYISSKKNKKFLIKNAIKYSKVFNYKKHYVGLIYTD